MPTEPTAAGAPFPSSRWSLILKAGGGDRAALEELALRYRGPIYAYLRRSGCDRHDAEDVTQDFFAHLLQRPVLERADPDRGRFRAYLRTCLRNFLSNARAQGRAAVRGGDRRHVPLDAVGAERVLSGLEEATPDAVFDRLWAQETFARAMERLKRDLEPRTAEVFRMAYGSPPMPHKGIAARLGMSEEAVAASVHRTRVRLREAVIDEIKATLEKEEDFEGELADLLANLGGGGAGILG